MRAFDRMNFALGCLAAVLVMAAFMAAVAHYNGTERDRSVACSQAGGSYAEGRCDIR